MVADCLSPLPRHLAIIMDGNGRWAQGRGMGRLVGHNAGAESVREIVEACRELGIAALTLYAFSEENWLRPRAEVRALMALLKRFLQKERALMLKQGIRLNAIGELTRLPNGTLEVLKKVMEDTREGSAMTLTLALSYGGRQEIVRAARMLAAKTLSGIIEPANITEELMASHMYTAGLPEPDLLIRTSGELRISNFLLWQSAYTEFYFTPTPWPAFRKPELMEALRDFAARERRFGKTGEQVEKVSN